MRSRALNLLSTPRGARQSTEVQAPGILAASRAIAERLHRMAPVAPGVACNVATSDGVREFTATHRRAMQTALPEALARDCAHEWARAACVDPALRSSATALLVHGLGLAPDADAQALCAALAAVPPSSPAAATLHALATHLA